MNVESRGPETEAKKIETAPPADHPYWKRNVVIIPVTAFLSTIAFSMTTPFIPLMLRDLGVVTNLETWTGNMMLAFYLIGFGMNPIWGGLADHFGRKQMVLRATLGMGIFFVLATLATTPLMFACLFMLVGIFNGANSAYNSLLVATTPTRRLGTALTLTQSGSLIGRTLGPGIAALATGFIGQYHQMLRFSGGVFLIGGILALFIRDVKRPSQGNWRPRWISDLRTLVEVPRMAPLLFLCFISNMLWAGSSTIITIFLLQLIADNPGAGDEGMWVSAVATGLSVSSLLALPLWARLIDRKDPAVSLFYAVVAAIVTNLPLLFLQTPMQLVLSRIAFGFSAMGMQPAIVRLLSQCAPPGMEARAISWGQSFQFLASGVAPFVAGVVAPLFGMRVYFSLTILMALAGLILWIRSGRRAAKPSSA